MIATHRETNATMNRLIAALIDSQSVYRSAAQDVENPELQELLDACARQRARYAAELEWELRMRGATPRTHGTVKGALVRGWKNFRGAVVGATEADILTECDHMEEAVLEHYGDALRAGLPVGLNEIIESQYAEIQRAHHEVHTMASIDAYSAL